MVDASQLIANFNHAYDGVKVVEIDPKDSHIPDSNIINFTTDFGILGSQMINKETREGISQATLTSNDSGVATVSAA